MKKYLWKIVLEESSIQVKIRYMRIGLIIANFSKFKGEVNAEDIFKNPVINVSVESESVKTQDVSIDKKICSDSFLCAEAHPFLQFSAISGCVESPGGILELTGNLSVKGITRPIIMIVNFSDVRKSNNHHTASFNLFGKISLKDFDITHPVSNYLEDDLLVNATIYLKRIH